MPNSAAEVPTLVQLSHTPEKWRVRPALMFAPAFHLSAQVGAQRHLHSVILQVQERRQRQPEAGFHRLTFLEPVLDEIQG
jgi:hypothetical protein